MTPAWRSSVSIVLAIVLGVCAGAARDAAAQGDQVT